jgi:DNA polymerase III sliding clamp (beta) subunit (PCNA family)
MEFTSTAGELRDTIASARRATSTNAALGAYAGVFMSVKGRRLSVTGDDGQLMTITAELDVTKAKDGHGLFQPKPLGDFLATLDHDEVVTLKQSPSSHLEVTPEGSSSYRFQPRLETFPQPSASRTEARSVDLSRLRQALAAVRASTLSDPAGVQLVSDESGLKLHSTDNYRLSRAFLPEASFGDWAGFVPLVALDTISRTEIDRVQVDNKNRTLRFSGPSTTLTARLLPQAFPDVDGILSAASPAKVSVPVTVLRRALVRLNSIADKSDAIEVRLDYDTMTLAAPKAPYGTGSEALELIAGASAPFEFKVQLGYLQAACTSHEAQVFDLHYSASLEPLFLLSSEPFEVTTVIMPVSA